MEYGVVAGAIGHFFAWIDPKDSASAITTKYDAASVPLMQFTGFTDKKRQDVYDGDIVKMDVGSDEETICVVDYFVGGFVLIGDGYNAEWMGPQFTYGSNLEVIGNIYENPELLK